MAQNGKSVAHSEKWLQNGKNVVENGKNVPDS